MARKNQTSGTVTGKIDRGKTTDALIEKRKSKQVKIREDARIKSAGQNGDLKRQLKIQKALYEIADAASAVKDMQSFYKKLHKIVGKLMYAENFFIALYEPQTDWITWPYNVDTVDVEPQPPAKLSDFHGATGWVLRHGKTIAVVDGSWADAISRGEAQYVGTESNGIAVPLRTGEKTIGVLMVQSYIEEVGYQLDDVRVLEFVAQHISTALTRARAIEETRQRNSELQIINSIQQGLASKLDMQAIYDLVGDQLREIFDVQTVAIYTADLKSDVVHIAYAFEKGQKFPPLDTPVNSLNRYVLNLDATFVRNGDFPQFAANYKDYKIPEGQMPKSVIVAPVIKKKDSDQVVLIGLMDIDAGKTFSETDIRLVETVANAMSVALKNARLFDEVQRKNAEISESLERETASNDILRVIAESPTDIQPVLDVIARNAAQLSGSDDAIIWDARQAIFCVWMPIMVISP
jgi:GAF domain-containing protein